MDGGGSVSSPLGQAMLLRKVRVAAAQVAEVSLCGAVPPYRALLGGKLAALLALSREASAAWFEAFDGQVSEIQSKLAGREISRPASLLALSTTSLYAAGSAQYNRATLPEALGGVGWEQVGLTAGNGTLHFSQGLSDQLGRVLAAEGGGKVVTGTFGEGPSERLRKLRDGLARLGLPASPLLNHGMPRIAYVAELAGGGSPGVRGERPPPHHLAGPTVDEIAAHWRERWLAPRIHRAGTLDAVAGAPAPVLSALFPDEVAAARERLRAGAGEE